MNGNEINVNKWVQDGNLPPHLQPFYLELKRRFDLGLPGLTVMEVADAFTDHTEDHPLGNPDYARSMASLIASWVRGMAFPYFLQRLPFNGGHRYALTVQPDAVTHLHRHQRSNYIRGELKTWNREIAAALTAASTQEERDALIGQRRTIEIVEQLLLLP